MRRRDTYAAEAQAEHERRVQVLEMMGRDKRLQAIVGAVADELAEPPVNHCPKCGKELPKRGAHFHLRACKA